LIFLGISLEEMSIPSIKKSVVKKKMILYLYNILCDNYIYHVDVKKVKHPM